MGLGLFSGWVASMFASVMGAFFSIPGASSGTPSAKTVNAPIWQTVGPLFTNNSTTDHTCTASVVHSSSGDLVVTAAHCLADDGTQDSFAPGFTDGRAPFGFWKVQNAYVDSAWLNNGSPTDDIAVLRLKPQNGATVESVVGAENMGSALTAGTDVTTVGYVMGSNDSAIACTAATGATSSQGVSYPSFDCGGFQAGTSGSPWLTQDTNGNLQISGIIGGYEQGGCTDSTSFSTPITSPLPALLARADAGGTGDAPTTQPSSC